MQRIRAFLLIFLLGLLVFFVGGYWIGMAYWLRTAFKIAIPIVLLLTLLACRQFEALKGWYPMILGFFAASCGFLACWLVSEPLLRLSGLSTDSIAGIAFAKFFDALPIVAAGYVVARSGGLSPGDIYLQTGKTKAWLMVGLLSFSTFVGLFLLQARANGIGAERLLAYAPWTLVFVFSNAFMEEFHFRGLLLKSAERLLGRHVANLCIALVFALVHAPVQYTPDIFVFVALVFALALAWGYIIQKTESLWGSTLFHAGADLMIIIGIYNTYGIS